MNITINNEISYQIEVGNKILNEKINPYIQKEYFVCLDKRVLLFFDNYLKNIIDNAKDVIIIESLESNKNMDTINDIHIMLHKNKATRKSTVIAIGGGIIGDVVGLACSMYMRGVDFIQVPTTLLSQVDSSIGSKVAINAFENKNILGTFYAPKHVIIDTYFLNKLTTRLFKEGLVELIKHG